MPLVNSFRPDSRFINAGKGTHPHLSSVRRFGKLYPLWDEFRRWAGYRRYDNSPVTDLLEIVSPGACFGGAGTRAGTVIVFLVLDMAMWVPIIFYRTGGAAD
jgi:hypothetical protein